jgi:hypothetical protein
MKGAYENPRPAMAYEVLAMHYPTAFTAPLIIIPVTGDIDHLSVCTQQILPFRVRSLLHPLNK